LPNSCAGGAHLGAASPPSDRSSPNLVSEPGGGDPVRHEQLEAAATGGSLLTFEKAALPLAVIDPTGRIVMANRAAHAMLGYEFNELVGRSVDDVVISAPLAWRARIETGATSTPEQRVRLRCKDGSELTATSSSLLVSDAQGVVQYGIARAIPDDAP
jgi:PAS domain S-box-containing protein